MKLRDVLLKPIGKITAKDGIDIIRPNGDVKDAETECCIYIGDRVKNSSDKAIALIINEREITLEPGQVTTVIPITYGVIQKIAKLQDEIVNGKTIEELENSAAGKELIKELSSLGEAIFEHSGHYSNIHASINAIDFIKNIKELEAAPSREPNIYEYTNPISAPVSAPRIETPTHNIHGAEPKAEPKPEPKPAPMPFTKDHVVFIEDANGNGTLTVDENGNPFLFTTVRVKFPDNVRAFDIINVAKDDGSWTDGKVVTNVGDGYVEFDMPIQNDFGKRVKLIVEHLNQNGDHIATVTNGLNIDKLPPLSDITFPEDANGDGTLGLTENTTNPNSTTVRVGIPTYSGSGDIITIKDKDGTTTLGSSTLTPADKTRGYVEINVPVTKGKTLEIAVDLEHSTIKTKPVDKSLVIEPDPMPKLKATDITFTEDADSDGKLTPAENQTDPNKTTVRVALPNDTLANDVVNIKVKDNTHTGSHTVTTADKTRGYVEFEVPVTAGKTTDVVVNISRGSSTTADAEKGLEVLDNHAPKIGANDIIFTEDTDKNGTLSIGENTTNPNATTVRVKLPNGIKANDKVVLEKKDGSHNDDKVVTDNDITRGYVEFDTPISNGEKVEVKVHVERTHYIPSTPTEKVLQVEPNLKLSANDIIFTEDANKNGTLALTENTVTPNTTTVRVKLPSVIAEDDIVKIKAVGTSITDNKTITSTDKANGYVEFEVPLKGIKNLNVEALVQRGTKTYDSADKSLVIEKSPAPLIAANDITFTEDTNSNGHLSVGENQTNPATTTVKIDLPSGIKEGDIVTLKDNANHTYNKTIITSDKTNGHINFEVPVTRDTTLKVSVDVTRDTEKSTPATKDLIIDKPIPIIGANNIIFSEDGDSNNVLTPDENTTTPATTTIMVALPGGVKVGDKIKIADKNGTYTDSHVITTSDKTSGYIEFEVPARKGKTIDAEVKVERDGEDGGASHKTLKIFQPMGMVSLVATEDADGDLELTDAETADPAHTNVRVTLDSNVIVGDKVNVNGLKAGSTETKVHTVVADDITRGYIDFEGELKFNNSGSGAFHARGWLERGSETSANSFLDLSLKSLTPQLHVRVFLEDTSGDNKLQVLENTTDPDTTTLAIAIDTNTVKVGDVIKVKDANNASYTGTHTVTAADIANATGYNIRFEIPAIKGTTIKPKISVTRGSKTWGPENYLMDDLEIENDPRDQVSLSIDPINTTGHITDADLSHRTIKAVIRVNHKELLNDGYEIEVKVYDKTIKAYKQADGTYAADIRLADYKDDADQKITATLKNATVDMDDGSGHSLAMPVAEKTAEASYDTNFTRSVLDILNVNDYNVMTLADIKNDADVHINGEVRGIYNKTGDNVLLTLPNGNVITANVQADGTFSATIKPSALGYPTTTDYSTYNYSAREIATLITGKYINGATTYTDSHNFNVNLHVALFGLKPYLSVSENNDAPDLALGQAPGIKFKYLTTKETDKIFDSANGGKFTLHLGLDSAKVSSQGGYEGGYTTIKLTDNDRRTLSEAMNGWHYEVYLVKGKLDSDEYGKKDYNTTWLSNRSVTKIIDSTIVNGKINYEHEIDLKNYLPTKTGHNDAIAFYTVIVPPAGVTKFETITGINYAVTLASKVEKNHAEDKYNDKENVFSDKNVLFESVTGAPLNNGIGTINLDSSGANTFYYTSSVDKIDLGGFAFSAETKTNYRSGDSLFWSHPMAVFHSKAEKPTEAYAMINGKKYVGTIDPALAKVVFKDVSTEDIKNDPDHKYEVFLVGRDAYGNDIVSKKEYSYNVITEPTVSQADIENAFSLAIKGSALEATPSSDNRLDKTIIDTNRLNAPITGEFEQRGDNNAILMNSSKEEPVVFMTLENKYVSHLDHDITLKIESVVSNPSILGKLYWYDPSDNRVKEVVNGEITIKAGTHFKDIRIVQDVVDNGTLNYDSEVTGTNEYGATITDGSMSLKKQNITVNIKNSAGTTIGTANSYIADTDYDININAHGNVNLSSYVSNGHIIEGNRKIAITNTASTFNLFNARAGSKVPIEFKNDGVNVSVNEYNKWDQKELIFGKGNNVLNLSGNGNAEIHKISDNLTPAEIAANTPHTLKINRTSNYHTFIDLSEDVNSSYHGLHILKADGSNLKPLYFSYDAYKSKIYLKDLTVSDNVQLWLYNSYSNRTLYIDNFTLKSDNGTDIPSLIGPDDKRVVKNTSIEMKDSTIAGNIENMIGLDVKNSTIGIAGKTTKITLQGDLSLDHDTTFAGAIDIKALDGQSSNNNVYNIDMTIDKDFTLTDTSVKNSGTNKFTFGEHANVGNQATFNVDNSELIFESGSEFHGKVKAGSGNNSITIKSGATFDGTIDMGDSISNIVIEQGAHLGPNFHIGETGTGNEQTSGKYDTLTIFDDLDFNNVDVRGIEQINIGTKARGEMINLDLAYSELANLMRGNSNTIKFWGDNDNNLTLHNESGKTFAMAADQSGVSGQPYTRYEVTDSVAGTTLRFDVHNDINLHIQ